MKPKFEIGSYVVFKGTLNRKKRLKDYFGKPKGDELVDVPGHVFRVTDINVETCYGGTQIHYTLRGLTVGSDGLAQPEYALVGITRDLFKAREIELEAAPNVVNQ